VGLDPSPFFHLIEQRVEGGKREFEGASGALTDLSGDFEPIERFLGK
jgi:hypothetical protein